MTRAGASVPRKKPQQRRSRATVETIVEAAARVLTTESLQGFNTNRIADVAGVSIGSLYQYFPSKDALLLLLVENAHESLAEAIEVAVLASDGMTLLETIDMLAQIAVDQQYEEPRLAAALDREEARLSTGASNSTASSRILRGLEAVLERHAEALTVGSISQASHDCLAIAKGMVDGNATGPQRLPSELRRDVVRALHGYLTS